MNCLVWPIGKDSKLSPSDWKWCREKIVVPSSKPYVTILGGGWNNTILQWNDTADCADKEGAKLGTYWSASLAVEAQYFIARNITIKVCVSEGTYVWKYLCAFRSSINTVTWRDLITIAILNNYNSSLGVMKRIRLPCRLQEQQESKQWRCV